MFVVRRIDVARSPGHQMTISGEGMPLSKNPSIKGDLIVTFDVVFPRTLTSTQKQGLIKVLGPQ